MARRFLAVVTAVLLFLLAGANSAIGGPGGSDRPFLATGSGQVAFDPTNPRACPVSYIGPVTEVITGAGLATHLGRYSLSASHCPTPTQSKFGQMTLTAANGDQIWGTYTNDLSFEGGTVVVTGLYIVTGGTGRFRQASGRLQQHHVVRLDNLQVHFSFSGRLSY
jgi:hypothetical protein